MFLDLLEQEAREERRKGILVERRMERLDDRDGVPGRYPDQDEEEEDIEDWEEPEMDWDSEEREDPTECWIPDPDEVFLGPGRAYMALNKEEGNESTGEREEGAAATAGIGEEEPQAGTEGGLAEVAVAAGEHRWNLGTALQGTAAIRLETVLRQHAAVFAHSLQELGKCTIATMQLPLTNEVPVYQRRRRMSPQDIEVCTEKCQELLAHVEDMAATLAAIQVAGLTCHPGKCRYGHSSVEYLGFEVAGRELSIQKAKVEVLDRVGRPKDRSGLRALLGFLNYYRKFIPDFSKRATPLNRVLREDEKWQWGEAQETALKGLMEAVKSGAVLKLPDGKAPFGSIQIGAAWEWEPS
ncbi:unnamed protein product [Closterium sp. NIES-64]|nr:unnamed protein product [Closterium sp. NIES-64]